MKFERSLVVMALAALPSCDASFSAQGGGSNAPKPNAPVQAAPPVSGGAGRCEAPVRHADRVLRTTGGASLVEILDPVEVAIAKCGSERWPDEVLACAQTATDARGLLYDCYARAFGDRPLEIKRRFDALADNSAVQPAALTLDGDYLAVDATCGAYARVSPPAYAMYYLCGGDARGPFMTPDDIRAVYAALAQEESARHRMMTDLISKMGSRPRMVEVYENGSLVERRPDF